jgi:hypothetical protein
MQRAGQRGVKGLVVGAAASDRDGKGTFDGADIECPGLAEQEDNMSDDRIELSDDKIVKTVQQMLGKDPHAAALIAERAMRAPLDAARCQVEMLRYGFRERYLGVPEDPETRNATVLETLMVLLVEVQQMRRDVDRMIEDAKGVAP